MKIRDLLEKFTDVRVPLPRDMQPTNVRDTETISDNPHVRRYMEEEGWTFLGMGLNAMTFGKTGMPWVLRLTDYDPGYVRFWSVAKNSENPHLPEVSRYGKTSFTAEDGHHVGFYTLVERLKLGGPNENELMMATHNFFQPKTRGFLPEDIERMYPEWREALELIQRANLSPRSQRNKYNIDFHRGNILYRDDVPVITDPYA